MIAEENSGLGKLVRKLPKELKLVSEFMRARRVAFKVLENSHAVKISKDFSFYKASAELLAKVMGNLQRTYKLNADVSSRKMIPITFPQLPRPLQ